MVIDDASYFSKLLHKLIGGVRIDSTHRKEWCQPLVADTIQDHQALSEPNFKDDFVLENSSAARSIYNIYYIEAKNTNEKQRNGQVRESSPSRAQKHQDQQQRVRLKFKLYWLAAFSWYLALKAIFFASEVHNN